MHCNDIADQAGQPTFVLSVKRAWKMLESTGFVCGEKVVVPTEKYGWYENAEFRAYRRDPPTSSLSACLNR